jgi:sensor histidine kinase YesM
MIFQPIVENAIKHGIGPKLEGGVVTLTAKLTADALIVVIEDNGVGTGASRSSRGAGIGLENIRERLRHIYGVRSQLRMEQAMPSGTRVVVEFPAPNGATR